MRLELIRLVNFGPYYGTHNLDVSVTPNAPIILIRGENYRGKTSLQNAVRWALYDEAIDRFGTKKPAHRLISLDALDAGEYYMTVCLHFSHDGQQFEIERHVQADTRPTSDADLTSKVALKRDGHILPEGDVARVVGTILHPDISRFFLFDGEMLAQYEALLRQPDRETSLIKQSIERILGLPALRQAADDLDVLFAHAQSAQMQIVRRSAKREQKITQADQLHTEIESLKGDIRDLRDHIAQLQEERDVLAEQRDRVIEIQGDIREADGIESTIEGLEKNVSRMREEIRDSLSENWWQVVSPTARHLAEETSSAIQAASELIRERAGIRMTIAEYQELLDKKRCKVCGQDIGPGALAGYSQKIEGLERQYAHLGEEPDIGPEQERVSALKEFSTTSALIAIREKERSIRVANLQVRQERERLGEIRERIKGSDVPGIREIQTKYDQTLVLLRDASKALEDAESRLGQKDGAYRKIIQEINSFPEANPKIKTAGIVYNTLASTFRNAIATFRDELRVQVEEEASRIFRELTTEASYSALSINEQYGLSILDEGNRTIGDRSAGAEQVVALSLIGALNRCAVREGPIMMDTPLGRLDAGHRAKVLTFLPSLGPQVILLVQSGEFDWNRDRGHLEGKLCHHYQIVRDGSPTKSRFEIC